mmetsp:Transcript_14704/g.40487  ORF Transcript_14704/g.40487 Transcript_14704/m.40487 type:complete len:118 (+) Transcript_14704:68-421(+)
MRHMAAYLLLVAGGNASPTADDVTKLLGTVGIEPDSERLNQLISELEGKDLEELIALGKDKLFVGGGAPAAGGGGGGGDTGADAGAAAAPEKPKEEEVDALEGGMDMFGGGGGGGDY